MGWSGAINAKVHATKSDSQFFATSAPDPPNWTVTSCFGVFHSVLVHLGMFCYDSKLGAKRAKLVQVMQNHKVASEVFANNAPNSPHWTLNSSFVALRCVWVHLDPFRYCFKIDAKWTELVQLMQKFMPRSRVIIFRNERTRSTPLDRNLTFWCVL